MINDKFKVKQKRYLNLENTLELLANLIWCKGKLKEYLKIDWLYNHLKGVFKRFHRLQKKQGI